MKPSIESAPPLVVDLDGTLLRGDLLHESAIRLVQVSPQSLWRMPGWLISGKARLKRRIAERVSIDVSTLPYDERVLDRIDRERASGRRIVLCTASDAIYAEAVATHLGRFDDVIASDGEVNVSAARKAALLVQRFGERGFDYMGNSHDDVAVWAVARRGVLVSAPAAVIRRARAVVEVDSEIAAVAGGAMVWLKAMRLHQWLKNLLVFLPLLGAHRLLDVPLLGLAAMAFVAFGLCASSVYLVNDLMDLESDRRHPRKRNRPFASGSLSLLAGLGAATVLLASAFSLALWVGRAFTAWLATYLLVTLIYTFWAKRKLLLDAIALAGLYTLRILAGAAAVALVPSFWLLAFSLFLFLSLAYVKRYTELRVMADEGRSSAAGRGYMTPDLALVEQLGVASGFSAVLVMALYLNSDKVLELYRTPQVIWLTLPLLLYWITRMWLQAHRNQMDDDPVLYAVRDRVSLGCGALFVGILWAATLPW